MASVSLRSSLMVRSSTGHSGPTWMPTTRTLPSANSMTSETPGVSASRATLRATSSSGLITRLMLSELRPMMPDGPR